MVGFQSLSFEQAEHLQRMEEKYPELKALKDTRSKLEYCRKRRDDIQREVAKLDVDLGMNKRNLAKHDALQEMMTWESSGITLERPSGPSFRQLRKAVQKGEIVYLGRSDSFASVVPAQDYEKEVFRFAEVLVIEHNWAAAFSGATEDVSSATVRLPYDVCAFEFKYSGEPVIALATQVDTDIMFTPAIHHDGRWFMFESLVPLDGYGNNDVFNLVPVLIDDLATQIKAACIALDAEVAASETVREPLSGTNVNNLHRPPKPYHIVSLARRAARAEPLPSSGDSGRRVRLHFRRGHWRHFEDHKTWIKWMLVGNPDLGFVEKHYRL